MRNLFTQSMIICVVLLSVFISFSKWQELTCEERYFDKTLSSLQKFTYKNVFWRFYDFDENFTKEYYLINLSTSWCEECIIEAEKLNQDNLFQEYFWISWSCDFGTYVDTQLLSPWINSIGSWSFVAEHSYELTWMTTYYLPQLFSSAVTTKLPTFLFVDRSGSLVRREEWSLSEQRVYDYCIRNDICLEQDNEENEEQNEEESNTNDNWEQSGENTDTDGDTTTWTTSWSWWGSSSWTNWYNGWSWWGSSSWTDWYNGWSWWWDWWWSTNWWNWEPWSWPPGWGEWWSGPWSGWEWEWNWDSPNVWIDTTPIPPSQIQQDPWRLQIEIPWENQRDVVTNESILTTSNSKDSLRITRRQINRWLRILFGVALLVSIVYAWFTFITSLWNTEKTKSWLKTFLYIWVAFALALFAFIIVRLVTNLFIS